MSLIEFRPYGSPSFDVAVPQGQPLVETPFQEINRNHVVVTQRYMQRIEAYKKPPENERMPRGILPSLNVLAYHCYDGPRTPINGTSLVQFDRVWATVPTSFEDQQAFTVSAEQPSNASLRIASTYYSPTNRVIRYTNLGIVSGGQQVTASAKNQRDFFLVGSAGSYSTTSSIPTRNEIIIAYRDTTQLPLNVELSSADYNTLLNKLPIQSVPITSGYVSVPYSYIPGNTVAGATNSIDFVANSSLSGNYVYGNSRLIRYIGNIWERRSVNITI